MIFGGFCYNEVMSKFPAGIFLTGLFLCAFTADALAGAGLDQRLRAVQQQRAYEAQRQQQALIQQRRAQQQAVVQREVAQRQAQVIAQQRALQMRAVAERQAAVQGQMQQRAVQQQQAAYQQAMLTQQARGAQQQQQMQLQQNQQFQPVPIQQYDQSGQFVPSAEPVFEPYVEEVVDMKTIWKDLEITAEAWPLIIDLDAKEVIVAKFMEDFRQQGIIMRKTPRHYVDLIDAMSFDNPDMLNNPLSQVLQTVAIIEYDYGNGVDPDALARRVLGEQGYRANKKRLKR